jgi:hypothetical protein
VKTAPCWVAASVALALGPGRGAADVAFEPVPASQHYSDAAEPGALQRACSASRAELEAFFRRDGVPFRDDLVQRAGGLACHIHYRPTVPGFRAAPEDDPVTELVFDADPILYLAVGPGNGGDAVGAMTEVLRGIRRPLKAGILMPGTPDSPPFERATLARFGGTPHRVTPLARGTERSFWWIQDAFKFGHAPRGPTLLVPRRLFEGRPENGEATEALLAGLGRQDRAVRSRLSWEGGDLQLTRDPRDTRRLVLHHGGSAKPYWGEALTTGELEYVLALELGADEVVDLGGLAPHVDYFAAFLPRDKTVLVSLPVSGDAAISRAAADALSREIGEPEPPSLAELRRLLSTAPPDWRGVPSVVERARREQTGWTLRLDPGLPDRMKTLVDRVCPGEQDCFSPENRRRLVEADPEAFAAWVHAVERSRDEQSTITAHLDLVQSQAEAVPEEYLRRARDRISELERIGFRVVTVPAYRVDLRSKRDWPGISYVNSVVVDDQIFVPRFGLGPAEDQVFRDLGSRLPPGYVVVPIDAQRALVRNGGLHCLAGLVR